MPKWQQRDHSSSMPGGIVGTLIWDMTDASDNQAFRPPGSTSGKTSFPVEKFNNPDVVAIGWQWARSNNQRHHNCCCCSSWMMSDPGFRRCTATSPTRNSPSKGSSAVWLRNESFHLCCTYVHTYIHEISRSKQCVKFRLNRVYNFGVYARGFVNCNVYYFLPTISPSCPKTFALN